MPVLRVAAKSPGTHSRHRFELHHPKTMKLENAIRALAGTMILTSLALAHYVSPNWLWLTAFVGANLFQSGVTNWCLMSRLLAKLGVPAQGACGIRR